MDNYTAWAGLQFLIIVTVIIVIVWRAVLRIFDLVESGTEKALDSMSDVRPQTPKGK